MAVKTTFPLSPLPITPREVITSPLHSTKRDTALLLRILQEILVQVASQGGDDVLSDTHLLALHSLFHASILEAALNLVDGGGITHHLLSSSSSREEVYTVEGGRGNKYVCFTTSTYCSCPSFIYNVLVKKDALLCKHQLAVRLASALRQCSVIHVDEKEWANLMALDRK